MERDKMRKKLLIVCSVLTLCLVGCGDKQKENENKNSVSVDVEYDENKSIEQGTSEQESTKEISEENVTVSEEQQTVNSDDQKQFSQAGSVRTALSDTNVVSSDKNNLPAGVAPEFTYFIYENAPEGMLKAQQYLEQIGVSKENEKLIVLWYQDNRSLPILIDEYTFDENTIYCVSHSFSSCKSNYKTDLENYGEESIDYTDEDAYYIRTVATQEPVNMLRSYDTFLESLNNDYKEIVW